MSPDAGLEGLRDQNLEPAAMFTLVLDSLRGRLRPVLMIIEDVHWADEGTLDFLKFIGRRVFDTNAVVICTYRVDEVSRDHPLRAVLAQLTPMDSTVRLHVSPLSLSAVETLALGHDINPSDLFEATGGNAFYVTETLAGNEPVPSSIQDAVLGRMHSLNASTRIAVDAVSVLPRDLESGSSNHFLAWL